MHGQFGAIRRARARIVQCGVFYATWVAFKRRARALLCHNCPRLAPQCTPPPNCPARTGGHVGAGGMAEGDERGSGKVGGKGGGGALATPSDAPAAIPPPIGCLRTTGMLSHGVGRAQTARCSGTRSAGQSLGGCARDAADSGPTPVVPLSRRRRRQPRAAGRDHTIATTAIVRVISSDAPLLPTPLFERRKPFPPPPPPIALPRFPFVRVRCSNRGPAPSLQRRRATACARALGTSGRGARDGRLRRRRALAPAVFLHRASRRPGRREAAPTAPSFPPPGAFRWTPVATCRRPGAAAQAVASAPRGGAPARGGEQEGAEAAPRTGALGPAGSAQRALRALPRGRFEPLDGLEASVPRSDAVRVAAPGFPPRPPPLAVPRRRSSPPSGTGTGQAPRRGGRPRYATTDASRSALRRVRVVRCARERVTRGGTA